MSNADHPPKSDAPKQRARFRRDFEHAASDARLQPPGPAVCPDCGSVFTGGHWTWKPASDGMDEHRCPACQRIETRQPAALLTLRGEFLAAHRDEILNLVRNLEKRERAEHPLKRIIAIEDEDGEIVVSFTETHLARTAGEALHSAYEGEVGYRFVDDDTLFRVDWQR